MKHEEDEDYLDGPEVQKLLDLIDRSWEVTPEVQEEIRQRFLKKLVEREPGHPWAKHIKKD